MLITNFNSIKVRLKPNSDTGECPQTKFQFHKGTIKTSSILCKLTATIIFQFHKGTIKTLGRPFVS